MTKKIVCKKMIFLTMPYTFIHNNNSYKVYTIDNAKFNFIHILVIIPFASFGFYVYCWHLRLCGLPHDSEEQLCFAAITEHSLSHWMCLNISFHCLFRFSLKCLPLCYPGTSRQDDRWEKTSMCDIL